MLIDYYDINKKKLKSEVSNLLSKFIYKYDALDNITINKPSRFIVTNNGYKDLDSAINSIKAAITL